MKSCYLLRLSRKFLHVMDPQILLPFTRHSNITCTAVPVSLGRWTQVVMFWLRRGRQQTVCCLQQNFRVLKFKWIARGKTVKRPKNTKIHINLKFNMLIHLKVLCDPILDEYCLHYIHLIVRFVKMTWWWSIGQKMMSRGLKIKTHNVVFETRNYLFSFSLMPVVDLYLWSISFYETRAWYFFHDSVYIEN